VSCFHPLPAFRDRTGGQPRIGYHAGEDGDKLELPCGRCVGCRQDRARAWSIRVMHEAQLYDSNLFVTLTYEPDKLPASLSLEYPHFQKFMRRLRKEMVGVGVAPNGKRPVRFFVSGEYGERYGRPHWHAILFNCRFPDQERWINGSYRSSVAERLWSFGGVHIGEVTPASACYVAGYTLSKVYGSAADDYYEDVINVSSGEVSRRRSEFCVMSRRPGIGAWWYERFGSDLFPEDHAVMSGKEYKVPRYYWEKFRHVADPIVVEQLEEQRYERSLVMPLSEKSEERRAAREGVAWSRVRTYSDGRHRSG